MEHCRWLVVSWIRLPCEPAWFDKQRAMRDSTRRVEVRRSVDKVGLYLKNAKARKNVMPIPGLQYVLATLHLHRARVHPLAG
jgi:hypothetical protein